MSTAKLRNNLRAAALAIDYGVIAVLWFWIDNPFLPFAVIAYGVWCYYCGGRQAQLIVREINEQQGR